VLYFKHDHNTDERAMRAKRGVSERLTRQP